ncbi:kunitz-type serine protease inhibitor textilinin-1-like [Diabrotica undecimpunctata]|uniref:kunitz-type serine protease inhibitor textilinin-1-like n=1 Tax=Diabrotica undecimpunctata TaxID=50387 RepID=UPI003B63AB6B
MKTTALFLCFCIIASSQVFGQSESPEVKVTLEDPATLAARPFRKSDCALGVEQDAETLCRALIPVYRWSNDAKKCVDDFYGGCHATKNNFRHKADCEKIATPICSS